MSSLRDSRRQIQSSPEGGSRIEWSDDEPLARRFMSKRSDSESLTGTSKSPKPKISLTRLSPIVSSDSNQGTTTKFTLKDLNRMANLYPWPKGVTLCLPVGRGDSLAKYPDSLVVHEESLKAGFRLPIPTFVRDFLRWTELCPAQFSPNSWRYFSAYGIRCWELNKEPTFLGMQYLFDMREKGKVFSVYTRNLDIISNPSIAKNWKKKWFLVKKGDGYDFDFPICPGIGVKLRKGADEIKEISGVEKELKDAFLSLERTNLHYSQLVTHENLENAGLSLPHPRQSMIPGLSLIKSAIRKQNSLNSSRSVGASKKRTLGSRSPLGKDEERPTKKRFNSVQLHNAEHIEITSVQPTPKSPIHQLRIATDSPHSPEGRPNYLTSRLTLEEANGLFKGATVNVEQASAEFARAVTLQVYHANNLIEKHEKLLSSHLGSHAKLEGLQEEKKELKQELLCAKESAKLNEESMKKQIQSLEDNFKKTQEENADNLKKIQEENAELRQKIMELKMDLSKAKDMGKEEFLNSNGFYRRVAHFNATYYMSGLRVGVCQAVKKYQHLDPKIVEFEPDFDDDCGYEVPDPPPYSSPIRLVPYPSL